MEGKCFLFLVSPPDIRGKVRKNVPSSWRFHETVTCTYLFMEYLFLYWRDSIPAYKQVKQGPKKYIFCLAQCLEPMATWENVLWSPCSLPNISTISYQFLLDPLYTPASYTHPCAYLGKVWAAIEEIFHIYRYIDVPTLKPTSTETSVDFKCTGSLNWMTGLWVRSPK